MVAPMVAALAMQGLAGFAEIDSLDKVRQWAGNDTVASLHPSGRGMVVVFGTSEWPSVHFKPATPLDLGQVGAISFKVTNPGKEPATFGFRADDDPKGDGNNHSRQGMSIVPSGKTLLFSASVGQDPKSYGMNGIPGPKGFTNFPIGGAPGWNPSHVVDLQLFMHQPSKATTLVFDEFRLVPPTSMVGIVDAFGQYTGATWPGKLRSNQEWAGRIARETMAISAMPRLVGRDRFGGWASGPKLKATGFFRTEKVKGKWWLVDPDGRLFFSNGVDCVATFSGTFVEGRESMFTWMPEASDPLAQFVSRESTDHGGKHKEGKTFAFYMANLFRKYGPGWKESWKQSALRRLPALGFNTIANWSDSTFSRNGKVPYVKTLWIGGKHKRLASGNDYWGLMHDPFDPEFRVSVRNAVADAAAVKGDPWCLGTFVDNELSWAGQGPDGGRYGLAIGALGNGMDSPAKAAFVSRLRREYGDVSALNKAWETGFLSWDELGAGQKGPWKFGAAQMKDMGDFVGLLSATYHRTVREELKKVDPDHLYLGCRFAWYGRDAVRAAVAYTDVISFNIYSEEPTEKNWAWLAELGKPVIIGEFHFGATDRGMFHPGLVDAGSQAERAAMYKRYVGSVAKNPAFVGCHWFQYVDEPLTGRTLDGENYQIGMVDVTDTPYPEAVQAAREIHAKVYALRSKS